MRMLDIAVKDLLRSIRGASFLALGFVVPLLMSALFYFAFGDMASDDGGFDLPATQIRVVNLDDTAMGFSAGRMLVEILQAESLTDLLQVTEVTDPASARAAVDQQKAGVALIIPEDFTATMLDTQGRAAIELYQDPTLTLGPGIVKGIINQVVDGFSGSKIAVTVASQQLAEHGMPLDPAKVQAIAMEYGNWAAAFSESQQQATHALLQTRSPTGSETEESDLRTNIVSMVMAGMLVFYVFFSGAATAQALLQEEEAGTLPRLFTTPTPLSAILGGRIVATLVTLAVQTVVLLVLSALAFKIDWGEPVPIALVTLGLTILASSFGLFITSLLKNARQGGIVYGGVMTVMGIVGMIDIFTANIPGAALGNLTFIPLLVPQGWAVRGWASVLEGGGVGDVLLTIGVMLGLSVGFFLIGLLRFRKRFA
jgi:ABC-2 type transport system permease protein